MPLNDSRSLTLVVVGWWALGVPTEKPKGPVVWGRFGRSTLDAFPVQIFAYTCAQNVSRLVKDLLAFKLTHAVPIHNRSFPYSMSSSSILKSG